MRALLTIRGEHNVVIHPYLPEQFCPNEGLLQGPIPEVYDCLINIEDCDDSYIDSVSPSSIGLPYYETCPKEL